MTNFVMGLASSPSVSHPVELAAGPFCHYHYSNLTKVLQHWHVSEPDFRAFIRQFVPEPLFFGGGLPYYALTHDVTKMIKAHSPCLEGRQYVPTSNNVIASNRALGVGYPVSVLHLGTGQAGWCPPLALDRIGPQEDANALAVKQIESLLREVVPVAWRQRVWKGCLPAPKVQKKEKAGLKAKNSLKELDSPSSKNSKKLSKKLKCNRMNRKQSPSFLITTQ